MTKNNGTAEINLVKLVDKFHSEEKCRQYLEELRWPNGVACPRCGDMSVSRIQKRSQYECNSCRYQFSVTSGTIFHDTHLPLWKWFLVTYTMIESKKGISANQIMREVGVSYKTAWYLCHRIRQSMRDAYPFPLRNIIEVDETWIGGKKKGVGHGYKGNKTAVIGAVERGNKIVLQLIHARDRETLHAFIKEHTAPDTEAIYTDDWTAYQGIADDDTRHETVNHSAEEWVRGDVHTNTIEGIWSLLKRSIVGSFHKVSKKHLDAYLDELEWRFNNRDNPYLFRDTISRLIRSKNLEYCELVATPSS